ncbi:MAG: hypothetical protein K2H52_12715 [Lachnospiraceae bacterium]|nr:hypothetical protein [Lachnospiraceae bacterium]
MDGMNEKKSGNAVKFIIPAAVGLVLVAILLAVAVATGYIGENPEKTLAKAFEKTFTQSGDVIKDAWQIDGYVDMFEEEQLHIDADIDLSGLGNIAIKFDKDHDRWGMLMGAGYYGISILEANLYMDEEEMRLGIPEWTDYVLYVDFATYNEDIEEFIEMYDLDDELADELRVLGKELQGKALSETDSESLDEAFTQLGDAMRNMWTEAKVDKADAKMLTVNEKRRSCEGYVVTIADRQVTDFLHTYKELYENNEALKNYLDQVAISTSGYAIEYEVMLEAFDQLEEACAELGDLKVYCYVYNGVLAQICFESGEVSMEWNICGGNFPLENTDLTITYDSEELVIRRSGDLEGTNYEAEYQIEVDGDKLILAAEYDKDSGDFRLALEEEYYFSVLVKGSIEKTVPGSEYVIIIDTFKVDDEELFYGDITVSNECEEIKVPEGDLRNVLKMTEDDWYEILYEIAYYLY